MNLGQSVDEFEGRAWDVIRGEQRRIAEAKANAELWTAKAGSILGRRLSEASGKAALLEEKIAGKFRAIVSDRTAAWERLAAALNAQSPLSVLKKGYAVVWEKAGRTPIVAIGDVRTGEDVVVSFHRGAFSARVEGIDAEADVEDFVGDRTKERT